MWFGRRFARRVVVSGGTALMGLWLIPTAPAQTYKGDIHYRSGFEVTIVGDEVSVLRGQTGSISCTAGGRRVADANPVGIDLDRRVRVVRHMLHAVGRSSTGYGTSLRWSLDATVSARKVSGTLAVQGKNPTGPGTCAGRFRVAAIVPPRAVPHRLKVTFDGRFGVRFDFKRGAVTHLTADANTHCPNGAALDAGLNSTAYRLDPIRVTNGRFRIATDILDNGGVVTAVVLRGRIRGHAASGTVASSRGALGSSGVERCVGRYSWRASSAPPPTRNTADVSAIVSRDGTVGAFKYYIGVRPVCYGTAAEVRFTVAGKTRTISCRDPGLQTYRLFGPVAPNRRYCIRATVILRRAGAVVGRRRLRDTCLYVQGM